MRTKKKGLSIFLNVVAWVSFVFALFMVAFTVLASHSGEQNAKEIFGVKAYIVTSDSMSKSENSVDEEIFFDAGDVILVKRPENVFSIKAGDVITFISTNADSYGKTITHKVKEVSYSVDGELIGYVTYGINTGEVDGAIVVPENVVGVYFSKIANVGNVFAFLKTPRGYFLSILTPMLLVIIFFSIKIGKIVERRQIAKSGVISETEVPKIDNINTKQEVLITVKVLLDGQAFNCVAKPEETRREIENELAVSQEIPTQEEVQPVEKIKVKKVPFSEKFLKLDKEVKEYFANFHNEMLSYKKVSSRISLRCISYRSGRQTLAKASVRGKTLLLHFGLDVNNFDRNVYFQRDFSSSKAYAEVPFTVKLKSARGEKRALALVQALMTGKGAIKKQNLTPTNVIKEIKQFNQNIK